MAMSWLTNENNQIINIGLAGMLGFPAAILLQRLFDHHKPSPSQEKLLREPGEYPCYKDGHWWYVCHHEDWVQEIPTDEEGEVEAAIETLQAAGVLIVQLQYADTDMSGYRVDLATLDTMCTLWESQGSPKWHKDAAHRSFLSAWQTQLKEGK